MHNLADFSIIAQEKVICPEVNLSEPLLHHCLQVGMLYLSFNQLPQKNKHSQKLNTYIYQGAILVLNI